MCYPCDPEAYEWEWEDHDGEVWDDPCCGILLVLGTNATNAQCLDCLVLDAVEHNSFVSWPQWQDGEVVQYLRSQFFLGRVDGIKMRRVV